MRYYAVAVCAAISTGALASDPVATPATIPSVAPHVLVQSVSSAVTSPAVGGDPAGSATGLAAAQTVPVVHALTPVVVEIMSPVGSKTSKTGETFPIHLVNPVVVDGVEVLPAGLVGVGEIIHAKKSGAGGGAGELVLAARYVECAGQKVMLRSMRVSSVGTDQTTLAMASAYALGIFAMAVKGKNTEIPAGTYADAKIAADFPVTGSCLAVRATPVVAVPTLEGSK